MVESWAYCSFAGKDRNFDDMRQLILSEALPCKAVSRDEEACCVVTVGALALALSQFSFPKHVKLDNIIAQSHFDQILQSLLPKR